MNQTKISIIIPTLNEAAHIGSTLEKLQFVRQNGHEIIVSDGGSTDNTIELSRSLIDHYVQSPTGRAIQMNMGAKVATGEILFFLHADTLTPDNLDALVLHALKRSNNNWGFFDIKLSGLAWPFRIIEWFINRRSQLTQIATGDQGIFVYQNTFKNLNGFLNIPLMEDIELTKRLKKISQPECIKTQSFITSSRRWEKHGILRTILLMWQLRFRYFLGSSPSTLVKKYRPNAEK